MIRSIPIAFILIWTILPATVVEARESKIAWAANDNSWRPKHMEPFFNGLEVKISKQANYESIMERLKNAKIECLIKPIIGTKFSSEILLSSGSKDLDNAFLELLQKAKLDLRTEDGSTDNGIKVVVSGGSEAVPPVLKVQLYTPRLSRPSKL